MNPAIKNLISEYKKRKNEIKKRLKEFSALHRSADKEIFQELCFCLLTANANARQCDKAIRDLNREDLILNGDVNSIRPKLKGRVRFHNKKASLIVGARQLFSQGRYLDLKNKINPNDALGTREWLVRNIKGLGYKEASHFLRNIGLGRNIAILDRHILKNLKDYGVIGKIPSSLGSRKAYLEIEKKMLDFSRRVRIPPDELDLLFWSLETGFVFK